MKQIYEYFSLYGSSTRSEYWAIQLITILVLSVVLLSETSIVVSMPDSMQVPLFGLIVIPTIIIAFWAQFATVVRRLRDAGINPWFALTVLIPYIGIIVFVVFGILQSEKDIDKVI